jgi:hypothetical protein
MASLVGRWVSCATGWMSIGRTVWYGYFSLKPGSGALWGWPWLGRSGLSGTKHSEDPLLASELSQFLLSKEAVASWPEGLAWSQGCVSACPYSAHPCALVWLWVLLPCPIISSLCVFLKTALNPHSSLSLLPRSLPFHEIPHFLCVQTHFSLAVNCQSLLLSSHVLGSKDCLSPKVNLRK